MEKYNNYYNEMLAALHNYCDEVDLAVEVLDSGVEYQVVLTGNGQEDIFGNHHDSRVVITTAVNTTIQTSGVLDIDSSDLKKIVRMVERAGRAYFIAFRESIFNQIVNEKKENYNENN